MTTARQSSRTIHRCAAILAIAALAVAGGARAADPPAVPPGAPEPKPVQPGLIDRNHHLGPGDVIEVIVEGFEELSRTVKLFTDGTFDYPVLGVVSAAGLTKEELRERITTGLRKELRRPRVQVNIREIYVPPKTPVANPRITALGAVNRMGEVELTGPMPLRKVLALVGWKESADLSRVRVRYPDGSARTLDFSKFGVTDDRVDDIEIRGGEEIILLEKPPVAPPEQLRIRILGDGITKRNDFVLPPGTSILGALEQAGGPTLGADLERVEVTGPAHQAPRIVNVELLQGGDLSANYLIQQGDNIVVKLKPRRVLVVGEVNRPGWVAIDDTETLSTVLFKTVVTGNSDHTQTELIRRGKDGKPVYEKVNVRDIHRQKRKDVVLAADDVIYVPHKKIRRGLTYYLSALATPIWLTRSIVPTPF